MEILVDLYLLGSIQKITDSGVDKTGKHILVLNIENNEGLGGGAKT